MHKYVVEIRKKSLRANEENPHWPLAFGHINFFPAKLRAKRERDKTWKHVNLDEISVKQYEMIGKNATWIWSFAKLETLQRFDFKRGRPLAPRHEFTCYHSKNGPLFCIQHFHENNSKYGSIPLSWQSPLICHKALLFQMSRHYPHSHLQATLSSVDQNLWLWVRSPRLPPVNLTTLCLLWREGNFCESAYFVVALLGAKNVNKYERMILYQFWDPHSFSFMEVVVNEWW